MTTCCLMDCATLCQPYSLMINNKEMKKQFKNMKKNNLPVIIFVLSVVALFWFVNANQTSEESQVEELYTESQIELSLNDFANKYKSGDFERVVLQNDTLLQ